MSGPRDECGIVGVMGPERAAEWAARGIEQRFLPLVYMLRPLLKSHRQWPALARLMNLPASNLGSGAIASA